MNIKKISEVEIARGAAIVGVLAIHSTAEGVVGLPVGSLSHLIYLVINKAASFAVPAFILLSGVVLFYRNIASWTWRGVLPFYQRRLLYLVVPYLIWSAFYYVFNLWRSGGSLHSLSLSSFVQLAVSGSAGYHLYFVPLIVQYYVLFPFLLLMIRRIDNRRPRSAPALGVLFAIGLAIPLVSGWLIAKYRWLPDKSILASTYFTFFCLGGYIGCHYDRYSSWIKSKLPWVCSLTGVLLLLHIAKSMLIARHWQVHPALAEAVTLCYCMLATICLMEVGRRLPHPLLRLLGAASFGIYLSHPAIVVLWEKFAHVPLTSPMYHLNAAWELLIGLFIPLLVVLAAKRWKASRFVFGKM